MGRTARIDPVSYTRADVSFHLKVAESTHDAIFPLPFSPLVDLIVTGMIASVHEVEEGMHAGHLEHQHMLECIERNGAEGARSAMIEHLQHSLREPCPATRRLRPIVENTPMTTSSFR